MAITIEIKVSPSSGRQQCVLDKSNTIKCFLKSPPEDGKANQELIKFIAQSLDIVQKNVTIIAGHTARKKLIKIDAPLTYDQVLEHFGIDQQKKIFKE